MIWITLLGAILTEVAATVSLRIASQGKKVWYLMVGAGYALAFVLLGLTLSLGMGLGVAYGIWAATGVALTALAGQLLFEEPLTPTMILGLGLIIGGVLVIELGATH